MRVADEIIRVYKIYDIKLGSNDSIQISELNNLNRRKGQPAGAGHASRTIDVDAPVAGLLAGSVSDLHVWPLASPFPAYASASQFHDLVMVASSKYVMRPCINCIAGQDSFMEERKEKLLLNWGVFKLRWLQPHSPMTMM
jgi:hypothetical protein